MTDQDPALAETESNRDAGALLALGLSEDAPDADALAAELPQYTDIRLLGSGGMGTVWSARHVKLDRPVALKILHPELAIDPAFAERFAREARALAKLQHPGIVSIHDFGEVLGGHYLAMELVEGTDLRALLREGISPEQALAIVPQLCDALQYAHDHGVVHRDIKPENILIDREGRVKIADFGLAKLRAANERDTTTTRVLGTPHYMAPEQIDRPTEIDHRADIFALGVVLYEMLTGRLPVGRFDPPSRITSVDVRLDEVVLRSLEQDRERRFQHASEVKDRVVAIHPTPEHPSLTPDLLAQRIARERRQSSRWTWIAMIAGIAYMYQRGCYFESLDHFGYEPPGSGVLITVVLVWLGLWYVALFVDGRRHRNAFRGRVMLAKAGMLTAEVFLALSVFSIWRGGGLIEAALGLSFALMFGYGVWATAVEQRIPARLIFGPSWWITRFEAEHPR